MCDVFAIWVGSLTTSRDGIDGKRELGLCGWTRALACASPCMERSQWSSHTKWSSKVNGAHVSNHRLSHLDEH